MNNRKAALMATLLPIISFLHGCASLLERKAASKVTWEINTSRISTETSAGKL